MIHGLAILATRLRAPIVYLHCNAAVNILATFSFNMPNLDGYYHNLPFCVKTSIEKSENPHECALFFKDLNRRFASKDALFCFVLIIS